MKNKSLFIEPKVYEVPAEGAHVGVFADFIDLGTVQTTFGAKDQCKLIFLVDQNGADGRPLQVHVRCTKTRDKKGNLIDYVRALSHPAGLTQDSWELSRHVGTSVLLEIIHAQRESGTFANVANVIALPASMKPLPLPAGYVPREDPVSFPCDFSQPKPPQGTASAARPVVRVKGEAFSTGLQESQVPLE